MTHTIGHDMRVPVEGAFGVAIIAIVPRKIPDDERLVTTARQQHVRVLETGRQRGHPATVALQLAAQYQLFRHLVVQGKLLRPRQKCAVGYCWIPR